MKRISSITLKRLLILAVVLASIPLHSAVKGMVWFQEKELINDWEEAPTFILSDAEGRKYHLVAFRKEPVMLIFCDPNENACHTQAGVMKPFAENYVHRGLNILFVLESPSVGQMNQFEEKMDVDVLVLRDPGARIRNKFNVESFPTVYFIDKAGYVRFSQAGLVRERWGKIRKLIEQLIGEEM